jgi:hypothetical protein
MFSLTSRYLPRTPITQTTHPSPAEIATVIAQSFISLPDRLGPERTPRQWTTQVKEDIGSLGVTHGWDVCTSGFTHRFEREWLYDLIWYRNSADGHLSEVYLVLESEWNGAAADIKNDFEKLLLAKAELKIMVFQCFDQNLSDLFELLERGIRAFEKRSANETYILAAFNNSSYSFDVRQINGAGSDK